jgi:hypothetical protein
MVQASYSEANRFARPTLTDAEQIIPLNSDWNGKELYRGRQNVTATPQAIKNRLLDAHS